jgi:hypothetical protein
MTHVFMHQYCQRDGLAKPTKPSSISRFYPPPPLAANFRNYQSTVVIQKFGSRKFAMALRAGVGLFDYFFSEGLVRYKGARSARQS